jgi:catechol 2,3-dioxygenase-like lactoylglutathione lyase family enzyme
MLGDHSTHTTIPVKDLSRAREWYEEKLGVKPVRELPGGLMYEGAQGSRFLLYPSPNAGQAPQTVMGFGTSDIDTDVRELKSHGVVFEEYDSPDLKTIGGISTREPRAAWFKDCDGNILGIIQLP